MGSVKIGWAQTDITPIGVIGKKVSLIGQFDERVTDKVRDPIHAVAMAVEGDDGACAIIISMDLLFTTDDIMRMTREKLSSLLPEFPAESLIIAATHIHTGPFIKSLDELWGKAFVFPYNDPDVVTPEAYLDFLSSRLAEAATQAWNGRAPGGLAFKVGRVAVPQCRRIGYKDGSAVMYGKTDDPEFLRVEGGADNGVEYVAAYDASGSLTGVLINLACPAQVLEYMNCITADMWGEVRREWTECPYVLPICGAAGDITMRDLVRRDRTETPMYTERGMQEQAARIVRESQFVLSTIKPADILYQLPVKHVTRTITLPLWTVSDQEYREAKLQFDMMAEEYAKNNYAALSPDSIPLLTRDQIPYSMLAGIISRYEMQQEVDFVEMELHVLRLGDTVLVNNAFELYQDYAMQMKARSIAPQTIIAQLSCGNLGYLPTRLAVVGGSYSACVFNGFVAPEGGDMLVEKTLTAIADVFSDFKDKRTNPYMYLLPTNE